jgi:hypothetical protein
MNTSETKKETDQKGENAVVETKKATEATEKETSCCGCCNGGK